MASIPLTGAKGGSGSTLIPGFSGQALTQGNLVYRSTSNGKFFIAQATGESASRVAGVVAQTVVGADSVIDIITEGVIETTQTLVPGIIYALSAATAGQIAPSADLVVTNWITVIGVAISTTKLKLLPLSSGIQY